MILGGSNGLKSSAFLYEPDASALTVHGIFSIDMW